MKTVQQISIEEKDYGFNDYLKNISAAKAIGKDAKPLKIAVLRSYTAEMIEPVVRFRLLIEGCSPEFFFGDYNGYAQEILDAESRLYAFAPDVILVLVRAEELMPAFIDDFGSKPPVAWAQEVESAARQLAKLCRLAGDRARAQVIVQNIVLPSPYFGIYDSQTAQGQGHLAARFNAVLSSDLSDAKNIFVWDFCRFVTAKGYETLYEPKMWFTSKCPFKQSAFVQIGRDLSRYILSALGRVRKCVVMDLDNTLWGGIAGEDGMEGVRLGHDYPGNCYLEFQKRLLRLYDRGIILAINSKNNEADAIEIIEKHPDMLLRKSRFAAMRINWNDKAANLKELAEELNIGLESMIFIDDNPAECELVRELLPEVTTVCLPEKPYLIPAVVDQLPLVENIRLTDEDRKKGEMYRAQADRKSFERSFSNLDDFLSGLRVEVSIEAATAFSLSRIAQLTQKTNQMNLTTRRYTEADIQSFMDDPECAVFSIASTDRFGDNGIVGVFILKFSGDECLIDTFLLSCRVIGRGIEGAMMAFIAEFAGKRGASVLVGEYLPTAKNKPASGMYQKMGFEKAEGALFTADIGKVGLACPEHIRINSDPCNAS